MGLIPKIDSPHYHPAKPLSLEEFSALFRARITDRINDMDGGLPIDDPTVALLWGDRVDYSLDVRYNGKLYMFHRPRVVTGDMLKPGMFYFELRDAAQPAALEPLLFLDVFGNIAFPYNAKELVFTVGGKSETINLQLRAYQIYLGIAQLSVRTKTMRNGHPTPKETRLIFHRKPDNAAVLTFNENFNPVSVCTCVVEDIITHKRFTFHAQYHWTDEPYLEDAKQAFKAELPVYFEVKKISTQRINVRNQ